MLPFHYLKSQVEFVMAKLSSKVRRKFSSRRLRTTPYPLPSCPWKLLEDSHKRKKLSKRSEKKDYEDATCSVCMEYPHNAVLLLCASYNKGCRPFMCATSYRHSNCLDQYKKAYAKMSPTRNSLSTGSFNPNSPQVPELLCPLCRGQVKGWTVVESAREYLNTKKRTCMQENCSFVGSYKELRKHVRADHPCARPREVDPKLEEEWKRLENERERNDVISTIRSSIPGAIVLGDYVIEGNFRGLYRDFNSDNFFSNSLLSLGSLDQSRRFGRVYRSLNEDDIREDSNASLFSHHHRRLLLGRSSRRRHREANGER